MMHEILVTSEAPFEYFCNSCGQLRLCYNPGQDYCGNCYSKSIIVGEINTLDKDKLKSEWQKETI
jgi:hypothetical protein